jgi:hypothetical protein
LPDPERNRKVTRTEFIGFCFAWFCLLAVACSSEGGTDGAGSSTNPAATDHSRNQADLSCFFPEKNDLSDLIKAEEYREFEGSSLFEYMNGGAEVYLALGFSRVGTREYETALGDGVYLTLEIYDMGNADDARTIFGKENGTDAPSAGVGEESALGGGCLAFHQGQFYVKVRCDDIGEDVDRLLKSAAGHLETKLRERS